MHRLEAYALLSRELQSWRSRPFDQLAALVGQPSLEVIVRLRDEDVVVRVGVSWADTKRSAVRIHAVADGPSCWNLERLEESTIVNSNEPQSA